METVKLIIVSLLLANYILSDGYIKESVVWYAGICTLFNNPNTNK